jgi:hypothetical protein
MLVAIIAVIVLAIVGIGVFTVVEKQRWEAFKLTHRCEPTKQRFGNTAWKCSNGKTYWRLNGG